MGNKWCWLELPEVEAEEASLVSGHARWAVLRGWQRTGERVRHAARRARPEQVLGRLRGWQRSGGRDCRAARRARPEQVLGQVRRGQGARGRWRAACFVRLGRAIKIKVLSTSFAVWGAVSASSYEAARAGLGSAAGRGSVGAFVAPSVVPGWSRLLVWRLSP